MVGKLIQKLEHLNFNKMEAQVYIELLKHKELNGSQIAKKLDASRSSVYSALNSLYNRGIVYLVPGDTNMYRAENPKILVEKMKASFEETTNSLQDDLLKLGGEAHDENYYNLRGTQNFISKVKELLINAETEVYMNTCLDLQMFKQEFEQLASRGVRIIVFTFDNKMDITGLPVELYVHPIPEYDEADLENGEIRLMVVTDLKNTLICSKHGEHAEMTGTFTENPLLANIVSEHIHHDIYFLKLKNREQRELIDEQILLDSLLENRNKDRVSLDYTKE